MAPSLGTAVCCAGFFLAPAVTELCSERDGNLGCELNGVCDQASGACHCHPGPSDPLPQGPNVWRLFAVCQPAGAGSLDEVPADHPCIHPHR